MILKNIILVFLNPDILKEFFKIVNSSSEEKILKSQIPIFKKK